MPPRYHEQAGVLINLRYSQIWQVLLAKYYLS